MVSSTHIMFFGHFEKGPALRRMESAHQSGMAVAGGHAAGHRTLGTVGNSDSGHHPPGGRIRVLG